MQDSSDTKTILANPEQDPDHDEHKDCVFVHVDFGCGHTLQFDRDCNKDAPSEEDSEQEWCCSAACCKEDVGRMTAVLKATRKEYQDCDELYAKTVADRKTAKEEGETEAADQVSDAVHDLWVARELLDRTEGNYRTARARHTLCCQHGLMEYSELFEDEMPELVSW